MYLLITLYERIPCRTGDVSDVARGQAMMVAVMIVPFISGKGPRKPNLGGRRAGRLHTRQETQNLGLKAITDKSGLVPIRFEVDDRETLMPLGDHAAHWANYLGELTQFDLCPHMESDRWIQIYAGIQQHLQNIYNGKKAALKEDIGFLKRTGVMTWNVSDTDVPRTFLR
nr:hypothetical protein [Tanacetum cinerariifolium]